MASSSSAAARGPMELVRPVASVLLIFMALAVAGARAEDAAPAAEAAGAGSDPGSELSAQGMEIAAASVPMARGVLTAADLPEQRPAPLAGGFCDYRCAKKVTVKAGNASLPNGVLYVDVQYRTIRDVNSTHMRWYWQNLAGTAQDEAGKTWPLFLLAHTRDHMWAQTQLAPGQTTVGVGTNLTWGEMILTGCSYDPTSATAPWKCPKNAAGFTRSSPASEWSTKLQTKETMTVSSFTARGIEFNRRENNPIVGTRTVATARHTWRDTRTGLSLRTELWVGLMADGSTTTFDTDWGALAAQTIIDRYVGKPVVSNLQTPANMTQVGWGQALHFLEEYGGMRKWLPRVWAAAQK